MRGPSLEGRARSEPSWPLHCSPSPARHFANNGKVLANARALLTINKLARNWSHFRPLGRARWKSAQMRRRDFLTKSRAPSVAPHKADRPAGR